VSTRRPSEAELHAFVDGELAGAEAAEVQAALASEPADLRSVREICDLNDRLGQRYAHVLAEPVPAHLNRLAARLAGGSRRQWTWLPAMSARSLVAGALLCVLAAAAGYLAHGGKAGGGQPAFVASALSAHQVFVPEQRHPVEVGAAEEKHLVQWLTRRLGAEVRAPELVSYGWKLVGGRLLPDRDAAAAQFMYEDANGRRLTLFVRKEAGLTDAAFHFAEQGDFNAFYWIDRALAYALAGRLDRNELLTLARSIYGQLAAAGGQG
jgi:anti-sigma factor RsiW